MEDTCGKPLTPGIACPFGIPSQANSFQVLPCTTSILPDASSAAVGASGTPRGGIEFEPLSAQAAYGVALAQGPRFDVPGPMMKAVRDPALSLTALSGLDPVGPVMVEVPPAQDNSGLGTPPALAGWRIGFADDYLRSGERETAEHSRVFLRTLEVLRTAGAQLVPVSAQIPDAALYFTLESRNEIDDRVTEHRLDALVSEQQSPAFHASCKAGYPGICLSFSDDITGAGVAIWFYGARWARDSLSVLVQAYQKVLLQNDPL